MTYSHQYRIHNQRGSDGPCTCEACEDERFQAEQEVPIAAWFVVKGEGADRQYWYCFSEHAARTRAAEVGGEARLYRGKEAEELFDLMDATWEAREEAARMGMEEAW